MDKYKKPKSTKLALLNPYGVFKQQENNYVGKGVIGIAATGLKTYLALVTYFSNHYKEGSMHSDDNKFFNRIYTINGKTKKYKTYIRFKFN